TLTGTGEWMTCPDSTTIDIRVKDVMADVEIDEANSNEDLGNYTFLNNSENGVKHWWTIYKYPDTTNAIATFEKSDTSRLVYNEFEAGEYKILLEVSDFENRDDPKACTDFDFVKIKVEPKIVVYNVFSPDDDGKNDWWEMELQAATEFELFIYNRWGELMAKVDQDSDVEKYQKESTGSQVYKFWDGTNRIAGGRATAGTYFYVFKYKFKGEEELETITGSITLVR
ncbi:MAG: gliding motility-associated C-terminal domain-containing protein, partial [Bacteroidia bacterium]